MSFKEWGVYKLVDVTSKIGDGLHGTPVYDDFGEYYFVNGSNLVDGKILITESTKRVSQEEFNKHRKELNQNTILLSINGTIGNVALYSGEKCVLGKSACYINVKEGFDKQYLKYILLNHHFQNFISTNASGTTIKNVNLGLVREYEFNAPTNDALRNKIGFVLSSIDDKIENNLATNQTLEEIARTLFKEWFVNFNYPNADGNLKHSEFGEIPESWEVGTLGDIYKTTSGGTPSRSKPEYYENGSIGWVKSKELNNSFIIDTEEKITEDALKNSSAKLLPKHSVLIAMYGATVGETGIITDNFTCNQAICAFLPNEQYPFSFIYNFLLNSKQDIISRAVGSAQQNISQQLLLQYKLVIPPSEIVQEYHRLVFPLFQKIQDNIEENESLKDLRDILLPKLMSGEIIVNPSTTQ